MKEPSKPSNRVDTGADRVMHYRTIREYSDPKHPEIKLEVETLLADRCHPNLEWIMNNLKLYTDDFKNDCKDRFGKDLDTIYVA